MWSICKGHLLNWTEALFNLGIDEVVETSSKSMVISPERKKMKKEMEIQKLIYNIMYHSNRSFNIPSLRACPGHLTPFPAWEGRHLITTHTEWAIWSVASMSCYELHGLINHGGDSGDKLWWIQRKRLCIHGRLVENQSPTQALFCIWRCLRPIYIYL